MRRSHSKGESWAQFLTGQENAMQAKGSPDPVVNQPANLSLAEGQANGLTKGASGPPSSLNHPGWGHVRTAGATTLLVELWACPSAPARPSRESCGLQEPPAPESELRPSQALRQAPWSCSLTAGTWALQALPRQQPAPGLWHPHSTKPSSSAIFSLRPTRPLGLSRGRQPKPHH